MTGSLPRGDVLSPEAQRARFARFDTGILVAGHPLTLLAPKAWTALPPPADPPEAIDGMRLVAFHSSDAPGADGPLSIQVFHARFPREILAVDYLRRLCIALRYQPLALEPHAAGLADSLVSFSIERALFRGRLVVRLYGPDVVVALAAGPEGRYGEVAELYGYLVRGVSAEGLSPGGPMEPRGLVPLGPHLLCEAPVSWKPEIVAGPDGRRGAVDLRNTTPEGALVGRMRIKWLVGASPDSPALQLEKLGQELGALGLHPGTTRFTLQEKMTVAQDVVLFAQIVQEASAASGPPELEVQRLVLEAHGHSLAVSVVSPLPEVDGAAWALARRAREIVLESFRPVSGKP